MKKIILVVIFLILGLLIVGFLFSKPKSQLFEGLVYDCETNIPISNARVQIHIGNDIFNPLSDSGRNYEGQTDNLGNFSIKYGGGTGSVSVSKYDEYLSAQGSYFLGGKTKIGLVKQDYSNESTISCKKISECTKSEIVNGVQTLTTICDMVLPKI